MKHRIVVLGAGYAGAFAAGNLARRLHPGDTEITVVNAEPDFVERMRLHQLAIGQESRSASSPTCSRAPGSAAPGARHRRRPRAQDRRRDRRRRRRRRWRGYDTLLYALGSSVADHGVPGVAEHAFDVAGRPAALRLRERLDEPGRGRDRAGRRRQPDRHRDRHRDRRVPARPVGRARRPRRAGRLALPEGPPSPAPGLRPARHHRPRAHQHRSRRSRRGRRRRRHVLPADATVWTAGFAVHPIAAASGLEVAETAGSSSTAPCGRSRTRTSTPPVTAPTPSARTAGRCRCPALGRLHQHAGDGRDHRRLTGSKIPNTALKYYGNHISLGRRDAIFQMVDGDARSKSGTLGGRPAARLKSGVLKGSGGPSPTRPSACRSASAAWPPRPTGPVQGPRGRSRSAA
jgi:NADH dehydrogenase